MPDMSLAGAEGQAQSTNQGEDLKYRFFDRTTNTFYYIKPTDFPTNSPHYNELMAILRQLSLTINEDENV